MKGCVEEDGEEELNGPRKMLKGRKGMVATVELKKGAEIGCWA